MDYDIIGAVKIKDGLFLGDEYAAQDLEFIVTNKVSKVINCSSRQTPNHWEAVEVAYLCFTWLETDSQMIFDNKDEVLNTTFNLIENTLEQAESVLVHSVRGQNRSVCVIAGYLMKKYKWTLYKTMEFLHSRRPDLEIKASFFNQLLNLENRLTKQGQGAKSYNWKELSGERIIENDEWLLTNTFLNAKIGVIDDEEEEEKDDDEETKKNEGIKENKEMESAEKVDEIEDFNLDSFDGKSVSEGKDLKEVGKVDKKDKEKIVKNNGKIAENSSISTGNNKILEDKVIEKKQSKTIRKIIWTDEGSGFRPLFEVQIQQQEQYKSKKKEVLQKVQQSFYRSILKGSNKIFSKNLDNSKENKESDIISASSSVSLATVSTNNSSGLRKIGSIKTQTIRIKKPEDAAQQEKRIIMQKIASSQKDITQSELNQENEQSMVQKSTSLNILLENDQKVQNTLNQLAAKQINEIIEEYVQPVINEEGNRKKKLSKKVKEKVNAPDKVQLESEERSMLSKAQSSSEISQASDIKESQPKKISRKDLQQAAMDSRNAGNHYMPLGQQKQTQPIIGKVNISNNSISNDRKINPYEEYDDEFIYGGNDGVAAASFRGSVKNTFTGNNTSTGNPYGMSVSAKNFFSNNNTNNINNQQNYLQNQNFYPLTVSNSSTQLRSNPQKFSIKNSFKSTQRIYSSGFVKQPQTNNFLFSQNKNTQDMGFQIQRLGNKVKNEDKKLATSQAVKIYSRPSTAPMKQTPYQRMIIGNSIKSTPPQYGSFTSSSQPIERQLSYQQLIGQLGNIPLTSSTQLLSANNGPISNRQSNNIQSQPREDSTSKQTLRSNSAGNNQTYNYSSIRAPQFGFFQSSKSRWK